MATAATVVVVFKSGPLRNSMSTGQEAGGSPVWAVDPHEPGENLPPVGRSLFDFLVMEPRAGKRIYKVPFPFATLLKRIESEIQPATPGISPLKRVLIPMGRSLQRNAAAPEFFKYPRMVVTVDTDTHPRNAQAGMLLKDRLYLGYQEKNNVLEVISYNETAGRFEFQVVKDYRAGATPRVFYANRALCTACHQNAAPIFARPLWDETNANPQVASRLRAERRDFHGFPIAQGVDVAYAIDAAAARANRFSAYQLLWREACAADAAVEASRCRGALFTAALQYRLSGRRYFDSRSDGYQNDLATPFVRQWKKNWPVGLYIPDFNIPNRNPLAESPRVASDARLALDRGHRADLEDVVKRSDVAAPFEPLLARGPLETWTLSSSAEPALPAVIAGLSEFMADADAERLDRELFIGAQQAGAPRRRWQGACKLSRPTSDKIKFTCRAATPDAGRSNGNFSAHGRVYLKPGDRATGWIEQLTVGGDEMNDLDAIAEKPEHGNDGEPLVLSLTQKYTGRHARLADGSAIEKMILVWPRSTAVGEFLGSATLTAIDDFSPVKAAVADMVARTESDAFSAKPFRRAPAMQGLFSRLKITTASWCCSDDRGMPPARLESDAARSMTQAKSAGALSSFYRYCAKCHETPDRFPPNFLYGEPAQVHANLAHCAERLYFRLSMWSLDAGQRPKTPMPPPYALQGLQVPAAQWPRHPDLAALRGYVSGILQSQTGAAPELSHYMTRGYGDLRACLPVSP